VIITSSYSARSSGPFSAVRPRELELVQDPAESSAPEPVDEMIPAAGQSQRSSRSASTQSMTEAARQTAGTALMAFPQIVHVLANPELHLGQQLAQETGLPVVSLDEVGVDELEDVLSQPEYAEGFILEGFPEDRTDAETLDGLLSATSPNERRVLGFDTPSEAQQEIVEHYIDQGLLWMVPSPAPTQNSAQLKSTMLECLVGLPALE
jgi:hypothetical protein